MHDPSGSGAGESPRAPGKERPALCQKQKSKEQAAPERVKNRRPRSRRATRRVEWLWLENKPAAQLERARIRCCARVGVELRASDVIDVPGEIRVIQEVEGFPAQLEVLAFGKLEGLTES